MTEGDVRPGMFLEFEDRTIDEPVLAYIVKDSPPERSWIIVDLSTEGPGIRYMSYFAVTKDVNEFDGDIDKAKKETLRKIFV